MLQFRLIVHRFEPTELAACVVVAIAVAAAVWLAFRVRDAAGVSAHRELRDSQQSLEDRIKQMDVAELLEQSCIVEEKAVPVTAPEPAVAEAVPAE